MKIIIAIFAFLVLIPSLTSLDEDLLDKNFKQIITQKFLEKSDIAENISTSLNQVNPEFMAELENVCEKSKDIFDLIFILTIGAILGYVHPLAGGVFVFFGYLNYTCILF